MKKLLSLFAILLSINTVAQINTDSLINIWHTKNAEDTVRVSALHTVIVTNFAMVRPDTAFLLAQNMIDLSIEADYLTGEAKGYQIQQYTLMSRGRYSESAIYGEKCLEIYKRIGNRRGMAEIAYNLTIGSYTNGNMTKAFEYCNRSLKIFEELGEEKYVLACMNFIGNIYVDQTRYSDALAIYKNGLSKSDSLGFKQISTLFTGGIGNVYHKLHKDEESKKYLDRSLALSREIGDNKEAAIALRNIGGYYERQGNLDSALQFYYESKNLCKTLVEKEHMILALSSIALVHGLLGKTKQGLLYADTALNMAQKLASPYYIKSAAGVYSEIYEMHGDGMNALKMYKLEVKMRDSISSEENKKGILKLEVEHQFEKDQLVKEQEEKEAKRAEEEEIEARNSIQYSGIGLGIFALFGMLFFMGKFKLPNWALELSVFLPFLIFFEFLLVVTDPYVDVWSGGEPLIKLLLNVLMAGAIFPLHSLLEKVLKRRLFKAT